jgi:hypothetical protein
MLLVVFFYLIFFAVYRGRDQIDTQIISQLRHRRSKSISKEEITLPWLNHLLRTVQSGNTLTEGLQSFIQSQPDNPYVAESNSILSGNPTGDAFAQFISENIRSGGPVSEHLRFFRRQLEQRIRTLRRANAVTAQARLQAIVLFFAPWGLLASLAVSDSEIAVAAVHSPFCWTLWTLALCVSSVGILWINRIVRSTIAAKTEAERLAEITLPNFLIGFYARIASGAPVTEAVESAIPIDAPLSFQAAFHDIISPVQTEAMPLLSEIRNALRSAALRGSPLKEEVQRFLTDCESQTEIRIEEALQKLPVKILAPLFICVLPSALIILFSFLFPALT